MELVSVDEINLGCKIILNEDKEEIKTSNDSNFDCCPKCKSNNVIFGNPDLAGTIIYREHICNDCETTWEERYDLVKVRIDYV